MPPALKVKKTALKQDKKDVDKDKPPVDKLSQSRKQMLGYLKYTGTESKGATKEQKEQAVTALKVYEALPCQLKRAFIERWKSIYVPKTWAGNKCNMGWIKEFEDMYWKSLYPTQGLFTRQSCTHLHVCFHASH